MPGITAAHQLRHLMHEDVFYPAHAPRTESPEYAAVHHRLTIVEDRPCFICDIRHSQLGDPSVNTHGVQEMETHHMTIEWALANAVDAEKLSTYLGHPVPDLGNWVDHDPENLLVLCDRHHRHVEVGIHELSYPIWLAQKFVRDDYVLTANSSNTGNQP